LQQVPLPRSRGKGRSAACATPASANGHCLRHWYSIGYAVLLCEAARLACVGVLTPRPGLASCCGARARSGLLVQALSLALPVSQRAARAAGAAAAGAAVAVPLRGGQRGGGNGLPSAAAGRRARPGRWRDRLHRQVRRARAGQARVRRCCARTRAQRHRRQGLARGRAAGAPCSRPLSTNTWLPPRQRCAASDTGHKPDKRYRRPRSPLRHKLTAPCLLLTLYPTIPCYTLLLTPAPLAVQDLAGAEVRFGDVGDVAELRRVGFSEPVDVVVSCLASRTGGKVRVGGGTAHLVAGDRSPLGMRNACCLACVSGSGSLSPAARSLGDAPGIPTL